MILKELAPNAPVEVEQHRNWERDAGRKLEGWRQSGERHAVRPQRVQQVRNGHEPKQGEAADQRKATRGVERGALEAVLGEQKHGEVEQHRRGLREQRRQEQARASAPRFFPRRSQFQEVEKARSGQSCEYGKRKGSILIRTIAATEGRREALEAPTSVDMSCRT